MYQRWVVRCLDEMRASAAWVSEYWVATIGVSFVPLLQLHRLYDAGAVSWSLFFGVGTGKEGAVGRWGVMGSMAKSSVSSKPVFSFYLGRAFPLL